jgi:hypothetical protein
MPKRDFANKAYQKVVVKVQFKDIQQYTTSLVEAG